MVTLLAAPSETDVFVIGGGPAGLAAAIAARRRGFEVTVADRRRPSFDKACGEGLMPDAVSALRQLGVELSHEHGTPFRGIRFLDSERIAEASFVSRDKWGLGIRRTQLHRILVEHASDAGVALRWESEIDGLDPIGVKLNGSLVRCRWIIGADGFHSRVRRWAGLSPVWRGVRRIGVRQHFRVRPWSEFVEVYWNSHCQAYVTPVSPDDVCVAIIGRAHELRLSDLPTLFPALANRLGHANPTDSWRGAISMCVKLPTVTEGRIALVGDASGSIDAVTGQGLAMAFQQANSLATAIAVGDLRQYEAVHRQLGLMPRLMAHLLLLMDGHDGLRRRVLRALAAYPGAFSRLLAVHVGESHPSGLSLEVLVYVLRLFETHPLVPRRA